jgi:uncharacterized protein YukE
MDDVVDVGSFAAMQESGGKFMQAATRMDDRLSALMRRVNAMNWDADSRRAFDEIQTKFNNAYGDLKQIMWELGSSVDKIAQRHIDLENYLSKNVWGGPR